jgi:hypothetical protein
MSILYDRLSSELRAVATKATSEHFRIRLLTVAEQWRSAGNRPVCTNRYGTSPQRSMREASARHRIAVDGTRTK